MLITKELKKRVESRDAAAMRELAILYLKENNIDKAALWIEKAAKFGDAEAQHEMANVCREKNDFNGSFQWEQKSAKQGFPKAQHDMAMHYQDGIGTKVNPEQEFFWLQKAAENGVTESKYMLAVCYLSETGTSQDINKAIYWLQQASNDGHANAKTRLGAAYIQGIGVSADKEKGLSLLREAVALGDEKAKELLHEVEETGSDSDSYEDSYEVVKLKKERRFILIGIIIGAIIGVFIGDSVVRESEELDYIGRIVIFIMMISGCIGIGGGINLVPVFYRTGRNISRTLSCIFNFSKPDEVAWFYGCLFVFPIWYLCTAIAGFIWPLIRILIKNKKIKEIKKSNYE